MREYIVKVRYALSGLRVFKVKTDNIYRIVGKFYCTSLESIKRIDYSKYTPEREQFWVDNGYKINGYTEPVLSEDEDVLSDGKVQYARWKGAGMGDYICSLCWEVSPSGNELKYCPNCGAKMDGEMNHT